MPVSFRRCVPDALYICVRIIRCTAVSASLRKAAVRLAAATAHVALRHSRSGAPAARPLGAPIDACGFVRALCASASAAVVDLSRLAALANTSSTSDSALATALLMTLPPESGAGAQPSDALIAAAGGSSSGPTAPDALASRAAGLLAVAGDMLRRELPASVASRAARFTASPSDPFAFPFYDCVKLAETFCSAAENLVSTAMSLQPQAAAATLQGPLGAHFVRSTEILVLEGVNFITVICTTVTSMARRFRKLLSFSLLNAIESTCENSKTLRVGTRRDQIIPPPEVWAATRALLTGPGSGFSKSSGASVLVRLSADAGLNAIRTAHQNHPSGVIYISSLSDAFSLLSDVIGHSWHVIPSRKRQEIEEALLSLGGINVAQKGASLLPPSLKATVDSAPESRKRPRSDGNQNEINLCSTQPESAPLCLSTAPGASTLMCMAPVATASAARLVSTCLACPWKGGVQSPLAPWLFRLAICYGASPEARDSPLVAAVLAARTVTVSAAPLFKDEDERMEDWKDRTEDVNDISCAISSNVEGAQAVASVVAPPSATATGLGPPIPSRALSDTSPVSSASVSAALPVNDTLADAHPHKMPETFVFDQSVPRPVVDRVAAAVLPESLSKADEERLRRYADALADFPALDS
jgi:hypothetical protein